ncbi:MAG: pore-forming ESAT-6 family protein [Solobacterium sp.]|nr:pore-forming ESAT-6 family protein [Solobacterium sp.]
MDNLKISLAEVTECASRIRSCNQQMYEDLSSMKREMSNTNVSWISDAGEAIRSKFNLFASRFETQKELIDSYAAFLDRTVDSYDTLETTITSNAESMQS